MPSVHCMFGHSGLYVGKAKRCRSGKAPFGLTMRCVEHLVGLFFAKSKDGGLPRYKVLRRSVVSASFLPIQVFE